MRFRALQAVVVAAIALGLGACSGTQSSASLITCRMAVGDAVFDFESMAMKSPGEVELSAGGLQAIVEVTVDENGGWIRIAFRESGDVGATPSGWLGSSYAPIGWGVRPQEILLGLEGEASTEMVHVQCLGT